MKKILLSLLCLISFMAINAETFTITFGDNMTSTSGTFLDGAISLSSDKNNGTNPPAYNANSKELRLYYNAEGNGCSVTLTTNGVIIKGVQLTASSTSYTPIVKYNVDGGSDIQGTWSSTKMIISDIEAKKHLNSEMLTPLINNFESRKL